MNFRLMNTTDLVSDDWLEDNVSPRVIDQVLQPAFQELALIRACQIVAFQRGYSLREQMNIWRGHSVCS